MSTELDVPGSSARPPPLSAAWVARSKCERLHVPIFPSVRCESCLTAALAEFTELSGRSKCSLKRFAKRGHRSLIRRCSGSVHASSLLPVLLQGRGHGGYERSLGREGAPGPHGPQQPTEHLPRIFAHSSLRAGQETPRASGLSLHPVLGWWSQLFRDTGGRSKRRCVTWSVSWIAEWGCHGEAGDRCHQASSSLALPTCGGITEQGQRAPMSGQETRLPVLPSPRPQRGPHMPDP